MSLHVLGAALVTVAAAAVWTGTTTREPVSAGHDPEWTEPSAAATEQPTLVERA